MNATRRQALWAMACWASVSARAAQGFDHSHAGWTALLKKHVVLLRDGQASQVRYAALRSDRAAVGAYLALLSAVSVDTFSTFSKSEQKAFLINAYNAFTVELILTKYPALKSIKDLGKLLSTPWKVQWITLLGSKVSLDGIEHEMLRQRGRFDDPRIHFAVNCASVGCPMLREEAFVPERLDQQLDDQTQRFMTDRTRNRFNPKSGELELSKIFSWYGEDFRQGHMGITSLSVFVARYADRLADDASGQASVRNPKTDVVFLEYDWALNDAP